MNWMFQIDRDRQEVQKGKMTEGPTSILAAHLFLNFLLCY